MSGEEFYINYSLNGEYYSIGPYHTRRFAMSHIEDSGGSPACNKNANYSHGEYRHCTAVTSSLTTGPGEGSAAGAGRGEGTGSAASTGRGEGTDSAASTGRGEGTGSAAGAGRGEGTGSAASTGRGEGTGSAASTGCGEGTGSAASTVRRECTGTGPNVQQWLVPSQIRCALGNLARASLSVMQAGEP
jgi:hypothetical protein